MEQERPVHHRVVRIAAGHVEVPGIHRVQALVVMHRPGAEVDHAHRERDERERGEGHPTPVGGPRLFRRADPLWERLAPWLRAWDRRSYPLLSLRHALSPP